MEKLTRREKDILKLLVEGKSNREIAAKLFISTHTVKANLEKIYEKYDIHNRLLLALFIFKYNLLNDN